MSYFMGIDLGTSSTKNTDHGGKWKNSRDRKCQLRDTDPADFLCGAGSAGMVGGC